MYFMALKKSNSVLMLWFVHVLKTVHIKQSKGIHSPKLGMREDSGGAFPFKTLLRIPPPPPPPPGLKPESRQFPSSEALQLQSLWGFTALRLRFHRVKC